MPIQFNVVNNTVYYVLLKNLLSSEILCVLNYGCKVEFVGRKKFLQKLWSTMERKRPGKRSRREAADSEAEENLRLTNRVKELETFLEEEKSKVSLFLSY